MLLLLLLLQLLLLLVLFRCRCRCRQSSRRQRLLGLHLVLLFLPWLLSLLLPAPLLLCLLLRVPFSLHLLPAGVAIFNFSFAVLLMPLLRPLALPPIRNSRFSFGSFYCHFTLANPCHAPISAPTQPHNSPFFAPPTRQSCVSLHARFLFVLLACSSCVRQPTISPPLLLLPHLPALPIVRYTPRFGSEFTFYVCPFFFAQFSCPGERPNTSQFPNPRRRFFSQKLVGNISFMIMYSSPEKCKTRITESAQDFRFISSGLSSCFKYNSHPFVPRTSSE